MHERRGTSFFLAAVSILLWGLLAGIAYRLNHIPPFLLVGLTLGIGSVFGLVRARSLVFNWRILTFGAAGIFGYHFFLFMAFRLAPPIEANLINYLWPVLIVLLSTVFLKDHSIGYPQFLGGILAFGGAVFAMTGGRIKLELGHLLGYSLALLAALIWSTYSVLSKRLIGTSTASVGGFCLYSAILSLSCHSIFEVPVILNLQDWLGVVGLGIGPMGIAFYSWDAALKVGDPRFIGIMAFFTPLISTIFLALLSGHKGFEAHSIVALVLIVCGAFLSSANLPRLGERSARPLSK